MAIYSFTHFLAAGKFNLCYCPLKRKPRHTPDFNVQLTQQARQKRAALPRQIAREFT